MTDEIPWKKFFDVTEMEIDWQKVYEMIINDMGGNVPYQPWV